MDPDVLYRALQARDRRYDGRFFVGVTTTGIYCRPVCVARTPSRARCRFYRRAVEAERDGFRACFRCRPELAPGTASGGASIDARRGLVARAISRIEGGALLDGSLVELAHDLGVSDRHLRRAINAELGVAPVELMQSTRLALAKQLTLDADLPLTQVALASGFRSLRRFNAAFRERFSRSPSALRAAHRPQTPRSSTLRIALGFREPYDWPTQLAFLRAHAIAGVEHVENDAYTRTIDIGGQRGTLRVALHPRRPALAVEVDSSLSRALLPIAAAVRHAFDLDADPSAIAARLRRDPTLAPRLRRHPPRLLGTFDGFEIAVRTILGQQVSVKAACTLSARFIARFGEPVVTSSAALTHVHPSAARIAAAATRDIAAIGLPAKRAEGIRALAQALAERTLRLDRDADPDDTARALAELPCIGPWTAQYVLMRALAAPDAFPAEDLALQRTFGNLSAKKLVAHAAAWRPWRGYAAMLVWNTYREALE